MYAILKTRIEYDPYKSHTSTYDYHDILPEVFDHISDAIAYIDTQFAEDEVQCPEFGAEQLKGDKSPFNYEVNKHKFKLKTGEQVYLVTHKTYENTSHHLYRWLEYEVFPVTKKEA